MNKVEVCFSPLSYALYERKDAIVVVVDILRATSAICTAFQYGVASITPVASIDEALVYQKHGFIVAAERKGEVVEGFSMGNSPFSFMNPELKDKNIVLTTTNGTQAINVAKNAYKLLIGSFLNLQALTDRLLEENKDVVILCSGWKDRFNIEDTLFAGALAEALIKSGNFEAGCDSAIAAVHLFILADGDLEEFLENSSHRKRLNHLGLEEDVKFCLSMNKMTVIPQLMDGKLVIV